ncbi:hypothetical protein T03_2038 [Trichinella britovi]|uniref:Uncharacterized protein n=1 Tax=Trichinella britovi TaxID=45882 RepID=A0A0V1BSA6_TRIBR|nr:hypothetical protein T03_2038 [Trichinella britovi]
MGIELSPSGTIPWGVGTSSGMFMVYLCAPTIIWKVGRTGKTETVVRQMDDDYTRKMSFVRRGAAYGVQQRRVDCFAMKLV